MTTLRVLGAVEIAPADGLPSQRSPATQPPTRVRRFLAALASRADEAVSHDWLAEAVWGAHQPANAVASLQTLASRLRPTLGEDGDIELRTQPPGYLLHVAEGSFDAEVFQRLAAEGARLLQHDPAAALTALDRALGLWTGPAYGEFADADFVTAETARLTELRAGALEDRVEAWLALGSHHQMVAGIEALVTAEPLRERRRAQLMLALYRAGRTVEALGGYHAFRTLLTEELGIEPSEALQDLHTRMLRNDPDLAWSPPVTPVTPVPPATAPEEAAGPGHVLVGRDQDLAELVEVVTSTPVVTLTGPGGVGKTSLARALADTMRPHFPDGVHVVALTPVLDPATVPLAVASALDVPGQTGATPLVRIVEWLAHQRALLLLDNCEHLLAPVAAVVDAIRAGAPEVHVLMTSQAPVAVPDEQLVEVSPLRTDPEAVADSPAVRLFVQRARAHRRDFALTAENESAIAEICHRLDGLPLAIELAAAKMRAMSPADLAERLSGRFRLLHGGARTVQERHRALRSLVDWSYGLLQPEERQIFEVLSVFAGRFTLAQAEALGEAALGAPYDRADVAAGVSTLVERSMVVSRPGSPTTYALLETLRGYGQDRLLDRGAAARVRDLHASQTAELVGATRLRVYSARHLEDLALVNAAMDEMRAAFGWSVGRDPVVAARIVAGAATLTELRMVTEPGHWAEALLERLSSESKDLPSDDLAWVHAVAASAARFSGELASAQSHAERAEAAATHPVTRCFASYLQGETLLFRGDLEGCTALARRELLFARASGLRHWEVLYRIDLALLAAYTGDVAGARAEADDVAAAASLLSGGPVPAWCTYVRGEVRLESDPAAAAPLLEAAVAQADANGDRFLYGAALLSLASVRSRHGDPKTAVPTFREAVEHWRRTGNWTQQWTTLRNVVVLLARLGREQAAATLAGALAATDPPAHAAAAEAERLRRTHESLVAHLGPEGYDEAARLGARLDSERLVDYALDQLR